MIFICTVKIGQQKKKNEIVFRAFLLTVYGITLIHVQYRFH